MKPLPPHLPDDVHIETNYDVPLTNQVDDDPQRGQCWGVWLQQTRIGEVHLGKTTDRLQSISGKPHRLGWMINEECLSPEYDNRNAAVMGLLEIFGDRDPSPWRTSVLQEGHFNDGQCAPINDNDNDNESVDDTDTSSESIDITENETDTEDENEYVAAQAKNSATQIKKFASCTRLWGWEYLEGIKPPQGAAAELGGNCHTVLEGWLAQGIAPDPATKEGKIVMPCLPHLPQPSKTLEVERQFLFELSGHLYRGFVDLGYWADGEPYSMSRVWVVHDHKTTSDFMWALTEEDLLSDVQAILYAKEAMDRHQVDAVLLSWLYMRTKRKAIAEPRRILIDRSTVESGMLVIQHYTDQMAELRRKHLPIVREKQHQPGEDSIVLTLDYNAYECGAYGGCPFKDRCNLSRREKMRSIMAQDTTRGTLKERMAARKAARAGTAPAAQPVESPPNEGASTAPATGGSAAPSINPPEQPPPEVQTAPLTDEEKAAEDNKGKGNGTAANDPKPKTKPRGRPPGAKGKKTEGFTPEEAFVAIFTPAVAGGETRHMEAAAKAWAEYKREFMD